MTLIEQLEAADEGSRELDMLVHKHIGMQADLPFFTTSIDAADTLRTERWFIRVTQEIPSALSGVFRVELWDGNVAVINIPADIEAIHHKEPVARCIAALKARELDK